MGGDPILFGRTQSAFQVPFASEPERSNGYSSKTTQEAIEETLALAVANDRLTLLPFYGGNAGVGRYLEIYSGIDMSEAPFGIAVASKALFLKARTTAANATCTIGFYDITPVTPTLLYTLTMTAEKSKTESGTALVPIFTLPAGGQLAIKIDSGSINKPHLILAMSATF